MLLLLLFDTTGWKHGVAHFGSKPTMPYFGRSPRPSTWSSSGSSQLARHVLRAAFAAGSADPSGGQSPPFHNAQVSVRPCHSTSSVAFQRTDSADTSAFRSQTLNQITLSAGWCFADDVINSRRKTLGFFFFSSPLISFSIPSKFYNPTNTYRKRQKATWVFYSPLPNLFFCFYSFFFLFFFRFVQLFSFCFSWLAGTLKARFPLMIR